MKSLIHAYHQAVETHIDSLQDVFLLALRLWVAWIFINAGLMKFNHWDSTLFLFEYEYKVPLIPWIVAAYVGTAAEIILPVFVAIGLVTRPMALALFSFNIVAVISYPTIWNTGYFDHQLWGLMMLVVVMYGAGRWSTDQLFRQQKY
ncbi:DoxX family protein [Candidatus Njordibacter sp. Uisw_056]|jgi:putative oxidoreductase|uniref:DoxX family protein n=1 Tax=Candidatus Njordibacter sp. Uisw_056 TaxID=3230973 RepID=UPI003D41ACAA|tara:strand:+ start:540 stop:980 length:441 start_codon:yes stop_codon:yes gene_type:complete